MLQIEVAQGNHVSRINVIKDPTTKVQNLRSLLRIQEPVEVRPFV